MSSALAATIPVEALFRSQRLDLYALDFYALHVPASSPRQLTGRRVAFRLEIITELRSLNLRRSWAAWGCGEPFSERSLLLSSYLR
jgi:hypothetical protein